MYYQLPIQNVFMISWFASGSSNQFSTTFLRARRAVFLFGFPSITVSPPIISPKHSNQNPPPIWFFTASPHQPFRSTFGSFTPGLCCHLGHPHRWSSGAAAQRSPGWHPSAVAPQRLQPAAAAGAVAAALWGDALAAAVEGHGSSQLSKLNGDFSGQH